VKRLGTIDISLLKTQFHHAVYILKDNTLFANEENLAITCFELLLQIHFISASTGTATAPLHINFLFDALVSGLMAAACSLLQVGITSGNSYSNCMLYIQLHSKNPRCPFQSSSGLLIFKCSLQEDKTGELHQQIYA
jgi:hypothetical protein